MCWKKNLRAVNKGPAESRDNKSWLGFESKRDIAVDSLVGLQQYLSNAVIQVGGSKHGREEVGEKGESEE